MIAIKRITAKETYDLRLKILRKNIDLPHVFDGDFDVKTFHLGAFKNNSLVGISSFMQKNNIFLSGKNQYQLRGMATLEEVRGEGCASALIDFAVKKLKKAAASILWCNAREVATTFYKKKGFLIIGEPFAVPQIGKHYVMYIKMDSLTDGLS